jgi:hypothetical protein
MLDKGTVDASIDRRAVIEGAELHNFPRQRSGPEHKCYVPTILANPAGSGIEIEYSETSLYRPKSTGDPRIGFRRLRNFADPGDILGMAVNRSRLVVLANVSRFAELADSKLTATAFGQLSEWSEGSPLIFEAGLPPISESTLMSDTTRRATAYVDRIVRNTAVGRWVKAVYRNKCQVCDVALATPDGPYSEGCHIVPVGRPHNGPDAPCNMLCLCPNHHVLLDRGSIIVSDTFQICDVLAESDIGELHREPQHDIGVRFVQMHRRIHGYD